MKQSFVTTVRATMTVTVLGRDGDGVTAAVRFDRGRGRLEGQRPGRGERRGAHRRGPREARVRPDQPAGPGRLRSQRPGPRDDLARLCLVAPGRRPIRLSGRLEPLERAHGPSRRMGRTGPPSRIIAGPGPGRAPKAADALITLVKSKEKYLPAPKKAFSKTREVATAIQPKGEVKAAFDTSKGRLVSLDGTETEDFLVNGEPVGSARNEIHLAYPRRGQAERRRDGRAGGGRAGDGRRGGPGPPLDRASPGRSSRPPPIDRTSATPRSKPPRRTEGRGGDGAGPGSIRHRST